MKTRLSLVLVLLAFAMPAAADTLVSASPWNPWVAPTEHNPIPFQSQPFWDNASHDGSQCNIGYWLSNTGGCAATSFYGGSFYANSPAATGSFFGGGASTFTVSDDPTTTMNVSPLVGVSALSGDKPLNGGTTFGWYTAGPNPVYTPMIVNGLTQTFTVPSGIFGFYLNVTDLRPRGITATYTTESLDPIGRSHFAVFDLGNDHWVLGVEDKTGETANDLSDYDYNDLVVDITWTPVPEPASLLLLGTGILGGAAMLRRRKR